MTTLIYELMDDKLAWLELYGHSHETSKTAPGKVNYVFKGILALRAIALKMQGDEPGPKLWERAINWQRQLETYCRATAIYPGQEVTDAEV